MNIHQKILEVMKKISYVKKDATVGSGGYSYKAVTHDNVVSIVRPLLIAQGIIIIPDQISGEVIAKKGEGSKNLLYEGRYKISFINSEKPDDRIVINILSHAADSGDKAPGKALTYAVKMAILKLFYLETGINDEERAAENSPRPTPASKEEIYGLEEIIGGDENLKEKIKKAYKVQFLCDLAKTDIPKIISRIKKLQEGS